MSRHHCSRCHVIPAVAVTSFLQSLSHLPCSRCYITVQSLSRHRAVAVTSPCSRCQTILAVGVTSLRVLNDTSTGRQFQQLCLAHTMCRVLPSHTMCSVTISHPTQCAKCCNLIPHTICRVLQSHTPNNVQCYNLTDHTTCRVLQSHTTCRVVRSHTTCRVLRSHTTFSLSFLFKSRDL